MKETQDASEELKPRSATETAQRVLALLIVVGKIHQPERCAAWMEKHDLGQYLSPAEAAFVQRPVPSEKSRVAFGWRVEAMASLIWALGGISEMPPLNQKFDLLHNDMVRSALNEPHAFVSTACLREAKEIDEMESRLYHQHWRARDAELVGIGKLLEPLPDDPPIEELDHDIVYERRYALSWLVGWGDNWDDVPTDT